MIYAICLLNVPAKPKKPSEHVPWLTSNIKKEDKVTKTSKASLGSPPIPQTVGLRCITMNYLIDIKSVYSEFHGLAMLQQQDG